MSMRTVAAEGRSQGALETEVERMRGRQSPQATRPGSSTDRLTTRQRVIQRHWGHAGIPPIATKPYLPQPASVAGLVPLQESEQLAGDGLGLFGQHRVAGVRQIDHFDPVRSELLTQHVAVLRSGHRVIEPLDDEHRR